MSDLKIVAEFVGTNPENGQQCISRQTNEIINGTQAITDTFINGAKEVLATITKPPITLNFTASQDGTSMVALSVPVSIAQASAIEVALLDKEKEIAAANNS